MEIMEFTEFIMLGYVIGNTASFVKKYITFSQ